jgi:membrane protein
VRRFYERLKQTLWRACAEFVDDRGHRDAAQIAFFAILSFVPLAMLLVASFGLIFDDSEVRERVVRAVFDNVPLAQRADRERLERGVYDALDNAGRLGPVSVLLLLAAASGVMGALRHSINQAWDIERRPPLLKRKALDVVLVLGGTVVLLFSLSQAAARETAVLLGDVMPFVFTAAVLLFLYRILPFPRPRVREIWPGPIVAALLIELIREALDFYFENLADLGALYGSLGALMGLLVFVYACANVVVFGAEVASEWSRVPAAKG